MVDQLKPIEKQILALMGESVWVIVDLEEIVLEHGFINDCRDLNRFREPGHFLNFLKKRPQLFEILQDLAVWSCLDKNQIQALQDENNSVGNIMTVSYEAKFAREFKETQHLKKEILLLVEQNPEMDCIDLFQNLPFWCRLRINSVEKLVEFLNTRNPVLLPDLIQKYHELMNGCENFRIFSPIDVIEDEEGILEI